MTARPLTTEASLETSVAVHIEINETAYPIRRGRHTVVELKALAGVPLADELTQVVDGSLTLLPDDGVVEIRGREQFISQPKSACSS